MSQMTRFEGLGEIARWLLREAHHRENRAKLKTGESELVPDFCTALRHLPRRHPWVELKFMTDRKDLPPDPYEEALHKASPYVELRHIEYNPDGSCYVAPGRYRPPKSGKVALRVTVYFGRPRGVGTVNAKAATVELLPDGGAKVSRPRRSLKDKKKLQTEARGVLRQAQRAGWTRNQVMFIDTRTSARQIQEQLAIFLERPGIGDASTKRLLGFRSNSSMKRETASRLLWDFADPANPGSYPAYKRTLRERIVGPAETFQDPAEGKEPADDVDCLDSMPATSLGVEPISEEVRQIRSEYIEQHLSRRGRGGIPRESYSVREAATTIGISRRKLYDIISAKACSVVHDKFGRARVPLVELNRIREEIQDREKFRVAYRPLIDWLVKQRKVQRASARRYIDRGVKKGKSLQQIYLDASSKPPQSSQPTRNNLPHKRIS